MSTAEAVIITRPRATEALDHGKIRQVFDALNFPGITVVWEGFWLGDRDEVETLSQTYHLATGHVFDTAEEALQAWDAAQGDHQIAEALGEALFRYRHGLMRPLWADRTRAQKDYWLAAARSFRRLLNGIGFDLIRFEKGQS